MVTQVLNQTPDLSCPLSKGHLTRFKNMRMGIQQHLPFEVRNRNSFGMDPKAKPPIVGGRPFQSVAAWLNGSLAQVDRIDREAEEEGYPGINELAKRNARHVLTMASLSSIKPVVYPSMDGEIAIYFKSPVAPAALLIMLNNNGGAGSYWSVEGNSQHQRHNATQLDSDFLSTRLRALGGLPLSQSVD